MPTNKPEVVLPELPEPYQRKVFATSKNTASVRNGFEMSGYVKSPDLYTADQMEASYVNGWNDCQKAMLSAAPQQHGQEVRTCMNPCSHIDFFNGRACDKCLGTIFSPANFRVQQPAEAVAVDEAWADFAGVYLGDDEGEATLDTVRLCRMAFDAGQRATPPPAIDIGKLRELVEPFVRHNSSEQFIDIRVPTSAVTRLRALIGGKEEN